MKVHVLGAHNLETHDTRHTCFLIDGVLGLDVGSLASALTAAEQGKVRALLLSHQHFDHIRDIPTLGLATLENPRPIDLYSLPETLKGVRTHLMNGYMYPDLTANLNGAPPKYRFRPIKAWTQFKVLKYQVKPIPVPHPVPCVGYIVKSSSGGCMAYTGDTGGDLLPFFQDPLSPQVLFVDVTFPNRLEELARLTRHLTPGLLRHQLLEAMKTEARMPRIVAVHMSLETEKEVIQELTSVAAELGVDLTPGHEDMAVELGGTQKP